MLSFRRSLHRESTCLDSGAGAKTTDSTWRRHGRAALVLFDERLRDYGSFNFHTESAVLPNTHSLSS